MADGVDYSAAQYMTGVCNDQRVRGSSAQCSGRVDCVLTQSCVLPFVDEGDRAA